MQCTKKDMVVLTCGFLFCLIVLYILNKGVKKPPEINYKNPMVLLETQVNDSDFTIGKNDAPVKMVFYGDFSCHHCIRFVHENFEKIKKYFIDTGKLLFVFRPVISTPATLMGAQYLFCEKRLSDMNALIFLNLFKNNWAFKKDYGNALLKMVQYEKWDSDEKFNSCISNKQLQDMLIDRNRHIIKDLKITLTPAVFINDNYAKANETIISTISRAIQDAERNKEDK